MRHSWRMTALAGAVALAAAACGSSGGGETTGGQTGGGTALKGVTISVAATWTGTEQDNFKKVLDAFSKKTGATVTYESTGDNVAAVLGPKIKQGQPPDVAFLPQPGLVKQFADQNNLKPLSQAVTSEVDKNYSPYWKELTSIDGKPFGVMFKSAHKSLMWYRADAFEEAGVQPPQSWADLVNTTAKTVSDAGTTPFVMCGGAAWTLTDWFENVYLSSAGPENYDKLAKHEIKFTDPTVGKALEALAQLWGQSSYMAPNPANTNFPDCVVEVFGKKKGAMVMEGDFVGATVKEETKATLGQEAKFFPFPKVGAAAPIVLGGDTAVALTEDKGTMELLQFLASPEAGETWAKLGGYLSPNKNVKADAYVPETKPLAETILAAGDNVRYDMSDLFPSEFGGTPGKGMWKVLNDFLKNPTDVKGAQEKLEADAAKAFK
jgi:alpha-glucoside transport system substrate-binding protein